MSVVVNHAFPNWNTPLPWGGFPTIFRHALISYDWFTVGHISHIICQYSHTHTLYIYICIHIATAPYSLIKSPCWCIESTTESTRPPVCYIHDPPDAPVSAARRSQWSGSARLPRSGPDKFWGNYIYICIVYDPYILIYSIRIMTIKMILIIYI